MAVTLITGDTVYWQDSGDGNPRVAEIEEAPRDYPVTFDQSGTQEDFYVIPTDVMEHVVAGTVDMELFNIPGLIRQGLDDAATDELPVIVTFDQDQSVPQLARDADALPATDGATAVEGINGAGVRVDRAKASTFRQAVFGAPDRSQTNRTAGAPGLDGGVDKVMLDQMLEIDLSESVPQIGAPQAWDAGFTGEGVTVAVLDTGVDASHPDLAGQVVGAENFTDEPDATDNHGHGTHVASTIAGTGAASDGARIGVAPGADLVSGKVCNRNGDCLTSWIMAGMQWAAAVQDADVVNMSLGGGPADGTDPLSQLVNELSDQTGALFVTSAGNSGPGRQQVGSPGAADAALAVGAVDKSDQMAEFSSRGPRNGDHAVKPEITAPGVGIVAARATGTGIGSPVNDRYTAVNGTSMASPHVAGAAALLAQAQGLDGQQLKDALVSTATDTGYRWFEQGTGRVDIPAALDSPVYAHGTVNLGGIDGQAKQPLTYTNHGSKDITLTLDFIATDHTGNPVDGVVLSTSNLTVPAGGQASATITVTADQAGQDQAVFGGIVTATAADVNLRTAFGFGPPLHRVDIEILDSTGQRIGSPTAVDTLVWLVHDTFDSEAGGTYLYEMVTSGGTVAAHVPAGAYTILTNVVENEPDAGFLEFTRSTSLAKLETEIDADTGITLDAREAVPVDMPDVPRKVEKRNHNVVLTRELPKGADLATFAIGSAGQAAPVYVTPTPPGELAALTLAVNWTLAEPQPQQPLPWAFNCPKLPFDCFSETPAYIYNLVFLYEEGIPQDLYEQVTGKDLVAVPTRFHAEHPETLIRHQFETLMPLAPVAGAGNDVEMWFKPGIVTEYHIADDRVAWNRNVGIQRRFEGITHRLQEWSNDYFPSAEAGSRRGEERWFEAPMRMGVVDNREESFSKGFDAGNERFAAGSRGGTANHLFTPGFYLLDNTRGHAGRAVNFASWRMWNADTGAELDGGTDVLPIFPLPNSEAVYRLEQVEEFSSSSTGMFRTGRATTTWTFASKPSNVPVPSGYRCPLLQPPVQNVCQIQPLIQLEYDLGLDIHNQAPAGRAHRFTIHAGHHSKAVERAPVTSLTVQASYDDGNTWHTARIIGKPKDSFETGGLLPSSTPYQEYKVVLNHPPLYRTNGYVTLRVQAEDGNGGTVRQTIHRAYILK